MKAKTIIIIFLISIFPEFIFGEENESFLLDSTFGLLGHAYEYTGHIYGYIDTKDFCYYAGGAMATAASITTIYTLLGNISTISPLYGAAIPAAKLAALGAGTIAIGGKVLIASGVVFAVGTPAFLLVDYLCSMYNTQNITLKNTQWKDKF